MTRQCEMLFYQQKTGCSRQVILKIEHQRCASHIRIYERQMQLQQRYAKEFYFYTSISYATTSSKDPHYLPYIYYHYSWHYQLIQPCPCSTIYDQIQIQCTNTLRSESSTSKETNGKVSTNFKYGIISPLVYNFNKLYF